MGTFQSAAYRYLVFKAESTAGTLNEPATADFVYRIMNPTFTPEIPMDDEGSKYANGHHGEDQSIAGTQAGTLEFEAKFIPGSADATAPSVFNIAKMCGCSTVAFTTTGIALVRRKAYDDATYSIVIYDQEIAGGATTLSKFVGCVGNMKVSGSIGKPYTAKFSIKGSMLDIVDGTAVALNAGVGNGIAASYRGSDFLIHNTSVNVSEWEFDLGNELNPVYSSVKDSGISHFVLTGAKPRMSCNPLAVKQATTDYLAKILSHTSGATSHLKIGTPGAGKFSFKMIDAQPISLANASREGLINWGLNFKGLSNGIPGTLLDSATGITQEDTFYWLQGTTA
jgi:hypothetical protein